MTIIEATSLVKTYKDSDDSKKSFNAVDGISLSINTGEIYGILGPNGAGKTTTLEMLEGLKDIDGGTAFINSIDVSNNPYDFFNAAHMGISTISTAQTASTNKQTATNITDHAVPKVPAPPPPAKRRNCSRWSV